MATTMTVKGQVTIPKKVREALRLSPGDGVDFDVNREGQVVVRKVGARPVSKRDRSQAILGAFFCAHRGLTSDKARRQRHN
ncbi:MAG: AbrB/MazE/SpoVT family DNA-binding domain-containing protein [Nitrococcus sp.]|nr:AbrB/MazE/SpoVT family DNA-binding domain-containing protein [Nitrococcus sp.]